MTTRVNTIIYPVKDLAKARELFSTLLGAAPYADQPYYVGFRVEEQEFGLDPNGHAQGMTGPVAYYRVADIRQSRQALGRRGRVARGRRTGRWWGQAHRNDH